VSRWQLYPSASILALSAMPEGVKGLQNRVLAILCASLHTLDARRNRRQCDIEAGRDRPPVTSP
jgi:hypothetical protein